MTDVSEFKSNPNTMNEVRIAEDIVYKRQLLSLEHFVSNIPTNALTFADWLMVYGLFIFFYCFVFSYFCVCDMCDTNTQKKKNKKHKQTNKQI